MNLSLHTDRGLSLMDNLHVGESVLRSGRGSLDTEQPSASEHKHSYSSNGVDTIEELGNAFHDTLQVEAEEDLKTGCNVSSDDDGSSSGLEHEDIAGHSDLHSHGSTTTSGKCLPKCATFLVTVGSEGRTSESQPEDEPCARSLSSPPALKIVSAIKGSREKEGVPLKKLSVSWAPDVYDPVPTSLSHLPKKKSQQQYKSNKKHGKGKHKGKNTRSGGSAPKDKKHQRKMSGRSVRPLESYADTAMVGNCYSPLELLDFKDVGDDIGGPDLNCGSSFLGPANGTMRCVC